MAVNSGHGEDKTRHERKRRPRWEEGNLQKLEGTQEVGGGRECKHSALSTSLTLTPKLRRP